MQSNKLFYYLFRVYSLNPAVDIGQLEGGFMMGLGLNTVEEVNYDNSTGQMMSYDTWVRIRNRLRVVLNQIL